MTSGITDLRLDDTPIAVIDLETTGVSPGRDRVVEISIMRQDPGEEPRIVLDSLVHPERKVAATKIHGITDDDVADAPLFADIVGDVVEAMSGCVLAAYNVYFDIKFLSYELSRSGITHETPHFCLMYLFPMLELGKRCKLDEACGALGIPYEASHIASQDALAASKLLQAYTSLLDERGVKTFAELAKLRRYKFVDSFELDPLPKAADFNLTPQASPLISRANFVAPIDPIRAAHVEYWDALTTVLADLQISDDEFQHIRQIRKRSPLEKEHLRALHAQVFSSAIERYIDDEWLDDDELRKLRKLHRCLSQLGWAPGE
ncbi:MAG: 3'-5' exonuclease [Planctomycetaceae bacterium]|nr:3'-5' exonuclease [Planctomycetaceae bacterium]